MKPVFIKENSWIAKIAARKLGCSKLAIVIGKTIYLYNTNAEDFLLNKRWVLHELKHIEQYERLGLLRFLILYSIQSFRYGYYNNKFEREARSAENTGSIATRYKIHTISTG